MPSNPFSPSALQAPDAPNATIGPQRAPSLQHAVEEALKYGPDGNAAWRFARSVLGTFGSRPWHVSELESFAAEWWRTATLKGMLPAETEIAEFTEDFVASMRKVKVPLGVNALASAKAQAAKSVRQADVARFGQRTASLIALCRALQQVNGGGAFYLSMRTANEFLGTADPYAAKNALTRLEQHGILTVERRGVPGKPQATKYRLNEQQRAAPEVQP